MNHCDPETLTLVALGDGELSADEADHARTCVQCSKELANLIDVVSVVRSEGSHELSEPPERVWLAVRESIAAADQPRSIASRRRVVTFLAAAACLAAIAGSFVLGRNMASAPAGQQVASASLSALPGQPTGTTGSATLLERNGTYSLDVETSGLPTSQGFYEVWLMSTDSGLVSVGTVPATAGHTVLPLPSGLPVAQFPVVDISEEPFDGKPEHSAVSVLRGQLSI